MLAVNTTTSYHCDTLNRFSVYTLSCLFLVFFCFFFRFLNRDLSPTYHTQEEIDVRSFVHEKPHRMPVDGHLNGKVMWSARFDDVARHRIVVRMDQCFVQIQNERFSGHQTESMAGDRRQREHIVFDWLVLCKLRESYQKNKNNNIQKEQTKNKTDKTIVDNDRGKRRKYFRESVFVYMCVNSRRIYCIVWVCVWWRSLGYDTVGDSRLLQLGQSDDITALGYVQFSNLFEDFVWCLRFMVLYPMFYVLGLNDLGQFSISVITYLSFGKKFTYHVRTFKFSN